MPDPESLIGELRRLIGFDADDEARLRALAPAVEASQAMVVGRFYAVLQNHVGARRVFEDEAQVDRLKLSLARWLREAFQGPWDDAYQSSRGEVGRVHVRIGLPQRYMLGAMQVVRDALHTIVERAAGDTPPAERGRQHRAVDRLLDLDQALMLETYHAGREAEATQAYDEIVSNTSDVVLTALPDGRVTQVNRDCPGVSQAEFLRDGIDAIRRGLTPESEERFSGAWKRVTEEGKPAPNIALTHQGPDDRQYHCLVTLLPDIREAGRMRLVRGVIRDVTELRVLEADLEERRRLASVGEMVAGVAHEVRNPLQAVLLGVRRATQHSTDQRVITALQDAREGVDQIERLVQDLLSFSKRLSLTLSTISAAALLESAVSSCASHFEGREPPVWTVEGGEACRFRADAFRMTQVLRNLVENAAEAAPTGTVTLHARSLAHTMVEITVTDTGPGLPDAVRARLFEPFVTTKAGGTGLGLAIARRLVEAHGGRMIFESPDGGGTRVRLTLPVAGPAADL